MIRDAATGNDLTGLVLSERECGCVAVCLDPMGLRWRVDECEVCLGQRDERQRLRAAARVAERKVRRRIKRARKARRIARRKQRGPA